MSGGRAELATPVAQPPDASLLGLRAAFLTMVTEKGLDDLTLRQFAVLMELLTAEEAATVRGIAGSLKLPRPAITRAMDRLEAFSLARRRPDPSDKRSVLLEITRRGIRLADQMTQAMGRQQGAV